MSPPNHLCLSWFLGDRKGSLTCSLSGNASSLRQQSGDGGGLAQGAARAEGAHSLPLTQWVCFLPCQVGIRLAGTYNSTFTGIKWQDQNVLVHLKPLGDSALLLWLTSASSLCHVIAVQIHNVIDSTSCHLFVRLLYAQMNFDASMKAFT